VLYTVLTVLAMLAVLTVLPDRASAIESGYGLFLKFGPAAAAGVRYKHLSL
jgi:hypothetical protein